MKGKSLSILLVVALLLAACGTADETTADVETIRGSGKVVVENREVHDFHAVALGGIGDLVLTQGDDERLTIEAEDNLMPYIKSEVSGGKLEIGLDGGEGRNYVPTQPIKFTLTVKNLDALTLGGKGSIRADNLTGETLTCVLAGVGSAELSGQVTRQDITVSGKGDYKAAGLESREAKILIAGAGNATLWVRDSLQVQSVGSGTVQYYGSPTVERQELGKATVQSLGDK